MGALARKLDCWWTLLIALAACAATAAYLSGASTASPLLAERGAVRSGELWRLITGPLVHATWGHLVRDLALLVGLGVAFEGFMGRRWLLACVFGLLGPTALVLVLDPSLAGYCGTSGLTHALLAAASVYIARDPSVPRWLRHLAITGLGLLLAKIAYELALGAPMFPMDLGPGVHQLPLAHATGALIGAVIGWRRAAARPAAA